MEEGEKVKSPEACDKTEEVKMEEIKLEDQSPPVLEENSSTSETDDTKPSEESLSGNLAATSSYALDELMDIGTVDQEEQEAQIKEEENTMDANISHSPVLSNTGKTLIRIIKPTCTLPMSWGIQSKLTLVRLRISWLCYFLWEFSTSRQWKITGNLGDSLLRRYIHYNDNQQCDGSPDRFYKIRPLFEMLLKECLFIPSTYKRSVDEVMVSYKGTRAGSLRQYVANKPEKWGFKVFCRASSSGIIHDLLVYQGPYTFFSVDLSEEEQELPLGSKVVTTLCKTISQPRISVVFCDNYFISFDLVLSLHANLGIKYIGTVRSNRIGGAHLIEDKELMKRGRGALDYKSTEGVLAVKWYDNKCVTLLSNACGIMPLTRVQRWSKDAKAKIAVQCPSLIAAYNQHMGGIDLSNMLVHLYKTPAKSQRWYFPLFGYALDLCISNSWLVYKRDCDLLNEKPMPLKMFRLAVTHSLKQVNKPAPRVGRPSSANIRYDNYGHWPLHTYNRGWCSLCPKGVSRWKCEKCNVFLCLIGERECFVAYHQK
uniref:PiggyBac transposable element-derived protein domain-containing protein n=1 Tax=Periophthalmus magnuspinnatus TaxID=409849 RepID=A0A3B4BMG1_9GOBI